MDNKCERHRCSGFRNECPYCAKERRVKNAAGPGREACAECGGAILAVPRVILEHYSQWHTAKMYAVMEGLIVRSK
jgi:hypothetical protein